MTGRPAIPFHRPAIGDEEIAAVTEVLRSGWLTTGPRTRDFEAAFARAVGATHAVAVNSGTAALHLSLLAAGVTAGDRVLTSPFTFPATAEAALYCGARPEFVDVDPLTLNFDPTRVEEFLARAEADGKPVRALVPVHYAGQPCAMERLLPLAERHGVAVVEDAAHALPAWRRMPGELEAGSPPHLLPPPQGETWRMVGAIGDFTAFSFYATKPLTTGEGGMITCRDDAAAELLMSLRLHGLSGDAWKRYTGEGSWRYDVARTGYKYNLPDVLAALGLVQLDRLHELAAERRRLAELYLEGLGALEDHVVLPRPDPRSGNAWHLFPIRLREPSRRNRLIEELRMRAIGTSVHFIPLHLHSFYERTFGYRRGDFPVAEGAYESILSLPLYPGLSEDDVAFVIQSLTDLLETRRTAGVAARR